MTPQKLKNLVTEAVSLDREIADAQERLDELKDALKTEAESRPEEHRATEGGGWSWTAEGSDGCICRVTQEGAKLKSSVSSDKDISSLKELTGFTFPRLFEPKVTYKPASDVREVLATMGKIGAKALKIITGKGTLKVSFETKEAA